MLLDLWGLIQVSLQSGVKGSGKTFIEREGQILLFKNASDAAEWVRQEKISLNGESRPVERKKKKRDIQPQVIEIERLDAFKEKLEVEDIRILVVKQDWEFLVKLQKKLEQLEDDELIVLLLT